MCGAFRLNLPVRTSEFFDALEQELVEKDSQELLRQMLNEAKGVVRISTALPARDAMMITRKRSF